MMAVPTRMPFNPLYFGEKLFQQYCVDIFIRIERDHIQWIKDNQKKLQVDNYDGVEKLAENEEANMQRKVILPSTFSGSPRFYSEYYEDAMALIRRYGMPDFFHTMDILDDEHDAHQVQNRSTGKTTKLYGQTIDLGLNNNFYEEELKIYRLFSRYNDLS
jgi:hypothetical protein